MAKRQHIHIHIPTELLEKILLNLSVKSLFRFSTVSKSWNSMIFGAEFVKRYRGREMVVLQPYNSSGSGDKALVCPLSSVSIDNAVPFVRRLKADSNTYYHASCGQFWCVEFERSLFFYNPSNQSYRKLPDPLLSPRLGSFTKHVFFYGLGYDAVSNDYKMLRIRTRKGIFLDMTELYSLASDSWREVQILRGLLLYSTIGLFVNGAVHWLVRRHADHGVLSFDDHGVLSFDLSTEKFRELALPAEPVKVYGGFINCLLRHLDMSVLRGKLCVCMNFRRPIRFVAWVLMEEGDSYSYAYSWVKEMEINYAQMYPISYSYLKPFYFYDGGENLIKALTSPLEIRKIFLYRGDDDDDDDPTLEEKDLGCGILESFTYVETLLSPWQMNIHH